MRRFLYGVVIMMSCGAASAAEIIVDTRPVFNALGLGDLQSQALPGISNINLQLPLPQSVDSALPKLQANGGNGLNFTPGSVGGLPELPGLGSLAELAYDVELPGLDGLPIQQPSQVQSNSPNIPGIDGLPLGYGRR